MAEGDGSAGIGGLYIAVGVEGDAAIREARQLHEEMARISRDLQRIGRDANFNPLTRKLEAVNRQIAQTKQNAATAGSGGATSRDEAKNLAKQVEAAHNAALAEDRRRQTQAEASAAARIKLEQSVSAQTIDAAHKAALARDKAMQSETLAAAKSREQQVAQALQAEEQKVKAAAAARAREIGLAQTLAAGEERNRNRAANSAARARAREVRAAESASRAEQRSSERAAAAAIRARDREAKAAERAAQREKRAAAAAASSRTGALKRGGADIATAGAAFASGNSAYGFANIAQGITKMSGALGGVASPAAIAAAALLAVVAAVGLLELGMVALTAKIAQFGISTAAGFETLQLQLEGLLGSAKKGREEMDFLLDLGKKSIVPTESLIAADRQLAAFGVEATRQRRELVQFISDFGTATSATEQQIYFLSLAIGQVAARGKADMVDIKQLGNAGITSRNIYKGVAEEIGTSWQKVRDGVKDGIITSDVLIAAITKMGGKYQETAEKARNSTNGLLANLKDIITVGMGRAFAGLNKQFGGVLKTITQVVNSIDFSHIADAVANVIGYIRQAFGGFISGDAKDMSYFFNHTLPQAINASGYALALLIKAFRIWFDWMSMFYAAGTYAVLGVAQKFIQLGLTVINVGESIPVLGGIIGSVADGAKDSLENMFVGTTLAADAAFSEMTGSLHTFAGEFELPIYKPLVFVPVMSGFNDKGQSARLADHLTPRPEKLPAILQFDPPSGGGGGGGKTDPRIQAMKDQIAEWKDLVDKAIEARKKLFDAFNISFKPKLLAGGMDPKEIAKLSDAYRDFTSLDYGTIVTRFKDMRQAIMDLYAPGIEKALGGDAIKRLKHRRDRDIAFLKRQTGELIRLSAENAAAQKAFSDAEKNHDAAIKIIDRQRDELDAAYKARTKVIERQYDDYYTAVSATEGAFHKGAINLAQDALDAATAAYESAQAKLEELASAREDFLSGLRESARSFVNDLSDISEEITRFTRLDAAGSFSQTTTKETGLEAFKKGLQDRVVALKKWVADVKTLMARGLDSNLLQDIVQQGPGDSNGIVGALAGASADDLKAINDAQAELAASIGDVQKASSAQWFDAGIAAQEAFTAPLKAAMESAQMRLDELNRQKDLAIGVLEAWNTEQTELLDEREKVEEAKLAAAQAVFDATLAKNQTEAERIAGLIDARLQKTATNAYTQGLETVQGLIDGLGDEDKLQALKEAAAHMARVIKNSVDDTLGIHSPAKAAWDQAINYGTTLASGLDHTLPIVTSSATRLAHAAISTIPVGAGVAAGDGDTYFLVQIGDDPIKTLVRAERVAADAASGQYVQTGRRI